MSDGHGAVGLGRLHLAIADAQIEYAREFCEGLPVEVEERLSAFFRPHDEAFFAILGRRLAWRT